MWPKSTQLRNDTFQDSGQDHYMSTQVIRLSDWKWLRELRKTEVTDRVANDPRSQPDTLLGVPFNDAQEFIEGGQADFDAPIGPLSPDDRVLLYAYSNQLGHLEELIFSGLEGSAGQLHLLHRGLCGNCQGAGAASETSSSSVSAAPAP